MKNIYLRAVSEADLIKALPFARRVYGDGIERWVTDTENYSLNVIGRLQKNDASYARVKEALICVKPPTPIPGFHANIRVMSDTLIIPDEIIISEPKTTLVEWA